MLVIFWTPLSKRAEANPAVKENTPCWVRDEPAARCGAMACGRAHAETVRRGHRAPSGYSGGMQRALRKRFFSPEVPQPITSTLDFESISGRVSVS